MFPANFPSDRQIWQVLSGADFHMVHFSYRRTALKEHNHTHGIQLHPTQVIWFRKELRGDRLGFQLLRGSGPSEGYVSIKIKGKEQNGSFDRLLFESSRWIITALFTRFQSKSGWIGQSSNRNDPNGLCVGWNAWNMVVRTQWRHSKMYFVVFHG